MKIVVKETLQVFDASELPKPGSGYSHIQFDFGDLVGAGEALDSVGLAILQMPDEPMYDSRYQRVTVGTVVDNDGVYSSEWVLSYIDMTQEQRRELIAEYRYDVETGGVEVAGQLIPTDRHTQQVLTAMYMRALGNPEYSIRFKTESGFVNLDAIQIIAIAEAVHDHVQAAFAREDELLTMIDNGEPITPNDWQ